MNKIKYFIAILTALLFLGSAYTQAETLELGDIEENQEIDKPNRGFTMNQVENRFGPANEQVPAVGDPPITRWIYSGFIVYFEHDRVIQSVVTSSNG